MKKELEKSVCVYRDMKHEETTKAELEKAKAALENVVNIWNGLDVGTVTDIVSLINNPEKCYSEALYADVEVPQQPGKYQIAKDVYIRSLSVALPNQLYVACKNCRKLTYAINSELWSVSGDQVLMNETGATALTDSQSIYVTTDEQKKRAEDILKFIELINMFALKFPSDFLLQTPSANNFFGNGKFYITQKSFPGPYSLEIIPSKLREWLQG